MAEHKRKIVEIDRDKCNGCGDCVPNCAEGAIQIIDGKATLVRDDYCDGLGACLGTCPMDAIRIVERDAEAFNPEAVEQYLETKNAEAPRPHPEAPTSTGGCPGSAMRMLQEESRSAGTPADAPTGGCPGSALRMLQADDDARQAGDGEGPGQPSQLSHWPVQLKLVPPHAPFLAGKDLLVAADCTPFAVADFHQRYLKGRAVVVGCPKLDDLELYRQKLRLILREAEPKSLTVLRMEVPCCAGIASAVIEARDAEAPHLAVNVHTIGVNGEIRREVLEPIAQPTGGANS